MRNNKMNTEEQNHEVTDIEPPNPYCAYLFALMTDEEIDIERVDIDCAFKTQEAKAVHKIIHESRFINVWDDGEPVGGPSTAIARVLAKAFLICCEMEHIVIPEIMESYIGGVFFVWNINHFCVIRPRGTVDFRIDEKKEFAIPFASFLSIFIEKMRSFEPSKKDSQVSFK
jgi:hypothetical protein